jgi:hypothetical protein
MHSIRIDILDSKAMQFLKGLQELKLIRVSEEQERPARTEAQTAFRKPGLAKGLIIIKDDFDDPIEGFDAPVE